MTFNNDKTKRLTMLVAQAGGVRKAEEIIKLVRGYSPSKSAIDRAIKGAGTDYNIKCMIDDLTIGLSTDCINDKNDNGEHNGNV